MAPVFGGQGHQVEAPTAAASESAADAEVTAETPREADPAASSDAGPAAGADKAAPVVTGAALQAPDAELNGPNAEILDSEIRVSPVLTLGPLEASRSVSETRVTLVGSHDLNDAERSIHALIEKPGAMVRWARLPLEALPEDAFVTADNRFVCLSPKVEGAQKLSAFNLDGELVTDEALGELLPHGAQRTTDPVSLVVGAEGARLHVLLQCGTVALVEVPCELGATPFERSSFRVCSLVLSDKHSCGVDAWLNQARELVRAGDVSAAKYALEAAIETDPNDARGYRELAQFYRRRGEVESRIQCLEAGVQRLHVDVEGAATDQWQVGTPAARLTYDYINAVHSKAGSEETNKALERVLELYPCMEQMVLLKAELLIQDGEVDAAVESLRLALGQLDPNADLAAAYHDVGRFLARHEQPDAGLPFLEDAFALGDKSEFLLRGLSDVTLELGRPDRAAEWLTVLATQWRNADNGDTEESRAKRAQERLRQLEAEIEDLVKLAAERAE